MPVFCFSFINSDLTKWFLKGRGDSYIYIYKVHDTDHRGPLAGWSAQTLSQLCRMSWARCANRGSKWALCLFAGNFIILWRFILTYSTRFDHWRKTTLFSQRCMFFKAETVTFHAQTITSFMSRNEKVYLMNRLPQGIHAEVWVADKHMLEKNGINQ